MSSNHLKALKEWPPGTRGKSASNGLELQPFPESPTVSHLESVKPLKMYEQIP